MYLARGFPRLVFSWLVAAAVAVQPVWGFSCGCSEAKAGPGAQPVKRRCCCCGTQQCHCCCGLGHHDEMASHSQRSCCQHQADRANALSGVSTCHCASGVPASPQSVPAPRTQTNDLTASVLCAHFVTTVALTVHQEGWGINLPTKFASASEHCIALGKLVI